MERKPIGSVQQLFATCGNLCCYITVGQRIQEVSHPLNLRSFACFILLHIFQQRCMGWLNTKIQPSSALFSHSDARRGNSAASNSSWARRSKSQVMESGNVVSMILPVVTSLDSTPTISCASGFVGHAGACLLDRLGTPVCGRIGPSALRISHPRAQVSTRSQTFEAAGYRDSKQRCHRLEDSCGRWRLWICFIICFNGFWISHVKDDLSLSFWLDCNCIFGILFWMVPDSHDTWRNWQC